MNILLTGAAGSGKTARVLREFQASARGGGSRIIVPTATLANHLRNELARRGLVFNPRRVQTLAELLRELTPEAAEAPKELFLVAVQEALRTLRPQAFADSAALPGFGTRLARTLRRLDAAGLTPSHLRRVSAGITENRDAIADVWEWVQAQLHARGLFTRKERLQLAAESPNARQLTDLWFDGFAQLSSPERRFVTRLGKNAKITFVLTEEGAAGDLRSTFEAHEFVVERLAASRSIEPAVFVAETQERECEEIARIVIERNAAGVPFHEIGVVLRKPQAYAAVLTGAFERFGIPARTYARRALGSHPAGRLFAGILDALLNGWEHEETIAILRLLPGVRTSAALDAFEIEVRKNLPGSGLDRLAALGKSSRALRRPLQQLALLAPWAELNLSPDRWRAELAQLPGLFAPRMLPGEMSHETAGDWQSLAQGYGAFVNAVDRAAAWWPEGSAPIPLREFWRVASSVVRELELEPGSLNRNAVQVIDAFEARQWDLDTVFIPGLVERQFPSQNDRDPFLPDALIRELKQFGGNLPTASELDEREQSLFDAAVTRGRNAVVLSYPALDARGQRVLPSMFLRDFGIPRPAAAVRPALAIPIAFGPPTGQGISFDEETAARRIARISISSLEMLLQCPFQFFAAKILRAAAMPDRPEDRLTFLVQGNIAHEVLRQWWGSGEPIAAVFDRVFAAQAAVNKLQPGFRTELGRRNLLAALSRFAADDQYQPVPDARLEQPFELAVDSDLTVTGRFDRIDVLPDGRAVIIDYKYSPAASTKGRLDDDTRLQGPLYALALRDQFGLETDTVLYVSLKGGKPAYIGWGAAPQGSTFNGLTEIPANWIDDALQRTRAALAKFRAGAIQPKPAYVERCGYCDFRDACRFEIVKETVAISAVSAP